MMKFLFTLKTLFCFCLLVLAGCVSAPSNQVDNSTQKFMRGSFRIASVSYPGSEFIKVQSFDFADSQCWVGTQWNMVANNNSGNVQMNGSGSCPSLNAKITWFVNKEGNVVLKFIDEGMKAKRVKDGYVLQVRNANDNGFQWVDKINVGNKPTDVVYQFVKN